MFYYTKNNSNYHASATILNTQLAHELQFYAHVEIENHTAVRCNYCQADISEQVPQCHGTIVLLSHTLYEEEQDGEVTNFKTYVSQLPGILAVNYSQLENLSTHAILPIEHSTLITMGVTLHEDTKHFLQKLDIRFIELHYAHLADAMRQIREIAIQPRSCPKCGSDQPGRFLTEVGKNTYLCLDCGANRNH